MVLKQLIFVLFITETLAFDSREKLKDESLETKDHESHYKEKHFEDKEKWHEKKFKSAEIGAAHQFEKDYSRWSDKKYIKHASGEHVEPNDYMKINEIDIGLYSDKYNLNGAPSVLKKHKKDKTPYHDKQGMQNEKFPQDYEKPGTLLHDTNVNYVNNNKKISGYSELINEKMVGALKSKENYQENYQNSNEMFMKREKKNFFQNLKSIDLSIPPANDTVLMARYIVHVVDWAAVGTLSGRSSTKGAPFVCIKAMSDGPKNSSSGVPFFYMSPLDLCTQDLQKDNRASILVTLSETEYCKQENLDPQDSRCARLTLSGKIKKIKAGSEEEKFAKEALFSRHPSMKTWPADHNWYFTKMKIGQIILLDKFGGASYIKVKDYFNGGTFEPKL